MRLWCTYFGRTHKNSKNWNNEREKEEYNGGEMELYRIENGLVLNIHGRVSDVTRQHIFHLFLLLVLLAK